MRLQSRLEDMPSLHATHYFGLALLSEFACMKDNSVLVVRGRWSLSVYSLYNMPTHGIDVCS